MNVLALEILREVELIEKEPIRNAIVSNERVREHEDLSTITWIGERFWISDHACVENDLAGNGRRRAEGTGGYGRRSIGQVEEGRIGLSIGRVEPTINMNLHHIALHGVTFSEEEEH